VCIDEDDGTMKDQIDTGDHVTAVMHSPANPFGSTQEWTFQVEDVSDERITGTDHMNDECEIDLSADVPHYSDSGKAKDIVEIRVHESHENGGYWGDKYETVWEA
jgi:hypothetical protein